MINSERGDNLAFERFDDYHGEKAGIKKLVMRVIPEKTNRVIELEQVMLRCNCSCSSRLGR
ncbi:hypothetical protein [Paramaledivibacter caminithermalis]|jgi:peptide/nickel transport system substrate-binding protein|uniref:Peptide/nickel transport system substrate-binding protein n=1 Tax=Paramaledivibacter caminithermalis (strain DSM 15212 / CIP 107654 / DViRD3) TaxID=1121301 RepID=A0A1M6R618_PARC5|nr:hypothetical protein [Paramaledivibacter caminithermalis]SHK27925.1 peptide/nickel transport system substrate-binding protein [Paramaledivibacter caminithermalis DSM 15212]